MADCFTGYPWQYRYCSSAVNRDGNPTNVLHDFYLPALERAVRYDRVAGYFRSTSLAAASQGYTAFLRHGGRMRLIVGADLQVQDVAAILRGNQQRLSDRLMETLEEPLSWPEEVQNGVALLGEMVASGRLEVRVAFRVSAVTGEAIAADSCEDGYVHEKWFIMEDGQQNRIYGSGSLNESKTALVLNAENVDIHCAWKGEGDRERTDGAEQDFERLWNNENAHMKVLPLPEAVQSRLVHLKTLRNRPTELDGTVLPMEATLTAKERLQFAVLHYAPRMPGGEYLGMYSAPVSPWPHQEIVSRRLIETWPYSYLMCDEVGLGKTIEAALAIRSLILSGRVKRVLIVAPASLTEQWHRELAQKAMLPFALSRTKTGGKGEFTHSYIYPEDHQTVDKRLYGPDLNIVSSGLVRLKTRRAQLRTAEPFDIVLVDEAHYARRKNPQGGTSGRADYGDLYKVLEGELRKKAAALWLATATPMQIDPIEVYDLFRLTNRTGQFLADPTLSMAYFRALGKLVNQQKPDRQELAMMGQSFLQLEKLDPYLYDFLGQTVISSRNRRSLQELPRTDPHRADLKYLARPLFAASPLSRVMMRHTRSLLEIYRANGQLSSNLAKRHVRPVCAIAFTPNEAAFYDKLEEYCAGLERQIRQYNPQTKQVMRFLLCFLRLRFASSFYAIQQTLDRRLKRVKYTLLVGSAPESEEELKEIIASLDIDETDFSEGDLDDITIDALLKDRSTQDLEWEKTHLEEMLDTLGTMHETPSKMQALLTELNRRKQTGDRLRQTVLFTRFYDTLTDIRRYLRMLAPTLRVGIFAGGNRAEWYDPELHHDCRTSHEEIKAKFLSEEIDLLLCTDAAAEGLNLQTADLLINFDLGWNPMKIEQRIGRIDRIGQKHSDIEVVNMCYVGSVEQVVYGKLLDRLKEANLIVGAQQISLLPVTQEDFLRLSAGLMTSDELERLSVERLKKQKEASVSMEMSAEDMYLMYSRMSHEMRQRQQPASIENLWDCLTTSNYLKSFGSELNDNGVWHLPASEEWPVLNGTNRKESNTEGLQYISWSNTQIDILLSKLGSVSSETSYIRLVTIPERDDIAGLVVSTTEGAKLIISYDQLSGLEIDETAALSDTDVVHCQEQLRNLIRSDCQRRLQTSEVEARNRKIANLHLKSLTGIAIEILKQMIDSGFVRAKDAVKHLDANSRESYVVEVSADRFGSKESEFLFLCSNTSGIVHISVKGILLECVIDLIKREVATFRRSGETSTSEVINRLDRM